MGFLPPLKNMSLNFLLLNYLPLKLELETSSLNEKIKNYKANDTCTYHTCVCQPPPRGVLQVEGCAGHALILTSHVVHTLTHLHARTAMLASYLCIGPLQHHLPTICRSRVPTNYLPCSNADHLQGIYFRCYRTFITFVFYINYKIRISINYNLKHLC